MSYNKGEFDYNKKPGMRKAKRYNHKYIKTNTNDELINVYNDTMEYFSDLPQDEVTPPILYNISDINIDELLHENEGCCPLVEVLNIDTLDASLNLINDGFNPLVLNMASKFKPGGGVASGKTAQEEVIFRRTNAFMTHPAEWYPLDHYEIIYTPKNYIVKDSEYKIMKTKNQKCISMLAVHALKNPRLINNEYKDVDRSLMELKIESIFKLGIKHGHDSLVLGALGCGAYKNPTREVICLFKKCLNKYGRYFKRITFAILSKNDDNYDIFKSEITNS